MTYNLKLEEHEINLVLNALAGLPYRDSFGIISNISNQVQAQTRPTEETPDK